MIFKYYGFDKNGKKIKGKIEASSKEDAINKLEYYITSIKPINQKKFNISFSKKVPPKELSKIFNTISIYLKSSIPLVSAISLTKNQVENGRIYKFLDFLEKDIKEGKSLYSAIESQKIIHLEAYITNTIQVAQESGRLDIVLKEIANFLKDEEKLSSKTSQALIYPIFVVGVAIFMIAFMLTSVVPKIVKVFQNTHQTLPKITEIVIKSGNFLENNWITILISFFVVIVSFKLLYSKNYKFRFFIHRFFLKIPILKSLITTKELGRFSYLVSVLVGAGVNYVTAIYLSINSIQNEYIKSIFQKALVDVKEGKKLSISLQKAGFFDKSFLQAIALGEETSQIEEVLGNVSEIYFEENHNKTDTLLSLLEPTLIVIIGISIGFIITAVMLPMFRMSVIK
jgi:general secretion pathway protein F/type IV pilus assembly protein PilC